MGAAAPGAPGWARELRGAAYVPEVCDLAPAVKVQAEGSTASLAHWGAINSCPDTLIPPAGRVSAALQPYALRC